MAKHNGGKTIAVAVGVGMLAALSAGAYFLYGSKEGAKRRTKIRGWALKAKGEVLEKMEMLKDISEEKYDEVIQSVAKKYRGIKSIDKQELDELVSDMKKHWKNIKRHLDEAEGSAASKVKKVARKVVRKTKSR